MEWPRGEMPGPERMRKLGQHKRVRAEVMYWYLSTDMYLRGHVTCLCNGQVSLESASGKCVLS